MAALNEENDSITKGKIKNAKLSPQGSIFRKLIITSYSNEIPIIPSMLASIHFNIVITIAFFIFSPFYFIVKNVKVSM